MKEMLSRVGFNELLDHSVVSFKVNVENQFQRPSFCSNSNANSRVGALIE